MPPNYLYKFEKINKQTLRNLKNAKIYFNTPASFNDPFDFLLLEASVMLGDDDYIEILKCYMKEKDIHIEIKTISDIPNQIYNGFKKSLKKNNISGSMKLVAHVFLRIKTKF
mmetsp:Transcript_21514/g.9959  ORF Transcript_21514/g.9959 Transcript_21514/m.9959 type:complete len:112 (+) Transcript_21514:1367-1702(+)